jgi:hypothetical protein
VKGLPNLWKINPNGGKENQRKGKENPSKFFPPIETFQ